MDFRCLLLLCTNVVIFLLLLCNCAEGSENDIEVSKFLEEVNARLAKLYDEKSLAQINNELTGSKDLNNTEQAERKIKDFLHSVANDVVKFRKLQLGDSDLQRQLRLIPLSYEVLPQKEYEVIAAIAINSTELFKKINLCSYEDKTRCNLTYMTDVANVVLHSEDIKEREYYWLEWRQKVGAAVKDNYLKFLDLYRKASKINGYDNPSDFWYRELAEDGASVTQTLDNFMQLLRPLYLQQHAYVRGQMRLKYGSELIQLNKPLPDHLFAAFVDNVTESVSNLENLPYDAHKLPNITDVLLKKGLTTHDIYKMAQTFFTSLGMPQLEELFWQDSCTLKADDDDIFPTHKVFKLYEQHHVNLTYTNKVTDSTFFGMFKALSEVYYNKAYANLSTLYQKEAMLDMNFGLQNFFALAASSPKYLKSLGISYPDYSTKEARINRLYVKGVQNIFLFEILYLLEHKHVGYLDNTFDINDNCASWSFSENISGVKPPVSRSKSDFDDGIGLIMQFDAQYATNMYMIALEYQLFEHFCSEIGEYVKEDPEKPLDLCDLTGHPEIGKQIYKAMSLGASVNAKQFLKALMGSEELNISGFMEYYRPLMEWLEKENKEKGNEVGWESTNRCQ